MSVIYEKGALRIHGPTADRPVAAVVVDVDSIALAQTFSADEIDGLAAAVLKARKALRAARVPAVDPPGRAG